LCIGLRETDLALFVEAAKRRATYVLVWVDDILVAGLEPEEIAAMKELLGVVFNVRNLGEATYFLRIEVTRDWEARALKLTQKKPTRELLARNGMEAVKERMYQYKSRREISERREAIGLGEISIQ
jgi:hypothetical protein